MANVLKGRDQRILDAAIECAKESGYRHITREDVAARAGVAVGTVNNAYGTMLELKGAVMQAAVEREIIEIVAQGLADGSDIVRAAPAELRHRAFTHIVHP